MKEMSLLVPNFKCIYLNHRVIILCVAILMMHITSQDKRVRICWSLLIWVRWVIWMWFCSNSNTTRFTYAFSCLINHSLLHSSQAFKKCPPERPHRHFPNIVTFPEFSLLQMLHSLQILQRCQSAFKQQTLEVLKHVDWNHARSSVSYIQPSCRGPWKRRAEVGEMKGEREGILPHGAAHSPFVGFRLAAEGTSSILMVSLLLKQARKAVEISRIFWDSSVRSVCCFWLEGQCFGNVRIEDTVTY